MIDRDVADHATVDEIAAVDSHRGIEARDRRTGKHRRPKLARLEVHDPAADELRRGRGEWQRELFKSLGRQHPGEYGLQSI